jgi:hypothetical protein
MMDMGTGLRDAVLAQVRAKPASGRVEVQPVVDVRKHLHPKQLEVFECDAPALEILGGRQCGKTFTGVGWQIEGGMEKPGATSPYFGLTRESAADIWWPEVEAWWDLLGFDRSLLHEHNKVAILPNGHKLKGRSTDDRRTIETARGAKYCRIVVDEMGAQDERLIRYFVNLLWPTMIKNRGRMVRSGNPGLALDGYWFDHTNANRDVLTPLYHWTAWDNPALGTPEEVDAFVSQQLEDDCGLSLERILEILEPSDDDDTEKERAALRVSGPVVTFLREWWARWVADQGTLVYPFELRRNGVDALPTRNSKGVLIDVKQWRYVAVCDPAGKGYTGFSVNAAHPELRRRFVVESSKHKGMLLGEAANKLRAFKAQYPGCRLALDAGGLGSVHSQQFTREFALYVEDAVKSEKASSIDFFRNNLIAGIIGVLNGPQNDAWRGEAAACGYDKQRLKHDPDAEDHCLDAAGYGDRLLRMHTQSERDPVDMSPTAVAQRFEDGLIAKRLGNAARHASRAASLGAAMNRR